MARRLTLLCLAVIGLQYVASSALAQNYPTRTVRVIIPLGPGGGGDIFTRALADELQKRLGQTFIVENRTGGGLNIGTRACAEAAPDGYTICVLSSEPVVYSQFLFKSLPFDPEKDFEPITNLFFNTLVLAINPSLNVKTIPELVALAKTQPLSYSTFSFPLAHFMEQLKKEHGVDIVRVPYRSGNEVVTAVLSGATPITLLGLANMVPQVQGGLITAIALNSRSRSPLVPKHSDAEGGSRHRLSAIMVRAVRAGRHAEADHRQAQRRGDAHHVRSGFHAEDVCQSRHRACGDRAGGVRKIHRRGPRHRGADRQRIRRAARVISRASHRRCGPRPERP